MSRQSIVQNAIWYCDLQLTRERNLNLEITFKGNVDLKLKSIQYNTEQYDKNIEYLDHLIALYSGKETLNHDEGINRDEDVYVCVLWSDYYLDDYVDPDTDPSISIQDILNRGQKQNNRTVFKFFPENHLVYVGDWQSDNEALWDPENTVTAFHYNLDDLDVFKFIFKVISIASDHTNIQHSEEGKEFQLSRPFE